MLFGLSVLYVFANYGSHVRSPTVPVASTFFFSFTEHVIYYIMYFFFLHGTSYNLLFSMIIYWSGYLCANYHSHVRSPTSAIAIFFSLEHVINYVVLSCIFFLHATCNILFSTQSKGVHNCNIGRAL